MYIYIYIYIYYIKYTIPIDITMHTITLTDITCVDHVCRPRDGSENHVNN